MQAFDRVIYAAYTAAVDAVFVRMAAHSAAVCGSDFAKSLSLTSVALMADVPSAPLMALPLLQLSQAGQTTAARRTTKTSSKNTKARSGLESYVVVVCGQLPVCVCGLSRLMPDGGLHVDGAQVWCFLGSGVAPLLLWLHEELGPRYLHLTAWTAVSDGAT